MGFIKGFFSNLFVGIDQVEGIRQSFRCPAIVTPQVSGERLKIQKLLINHLKIRYSTLLKSEIRNPRSHISKSGCAPAVESFWKPRHIIQIEIKPGHRPHHLSLLPSGSDEVHDRLLRGVQSKWSKGSKY